MSKALSKPRKNDLITPHDAWSVRDSSKLYRIRNWGAGYYGINAAGNITVSPTRNSRTQIDLKLLVDDLRKRNIHLPVLIRFMDILSDRIKKLHGCFTKARRTYEYEAPYYPVYPIKVNQQRQVVESMIQAGRKYNLGLEVGSKTELLAVLALSPANESLIICNGYKDETFLEMALHAKALGKNIIVVVEQLSELGKFIALSKRMNVKPVIGMRLKLSVKGGGHWADTSGDISKFGLRIYELVNAVQLLRDNKLLRTFQLIHFHIGSQISRIADVKEAMTEISRIYTSLLDIGVDIRYVDVGGGLGIDYDGTGGRNNSSIDYSIQEYANDIVYALKTECGRQKVDVPAIITESGRALTAHYSVLVTNVLEFTGPNIESPQPVDDAASPIVRELSDIYSGITPSNCREYFHDAIHARKQAMNLFNVGYMKLTERATADELFWGIMSKINILRKQHDLQHHEFEGLDRLLSTNYQLNFSLFQSLPDCWAVDQVFPIVPIHRLNEKPDNFSVVTDITCDSDGCIAAYVSDDGITKMLPLHKPAENDHYYIGFFLVGAYQEILGDLHNLFGDTNAVHIVLDSNGSYKVAHHIKGDTVSGVLNYLDYQAKDLIELLRKKVEANVSQGSISIEDGTRFMSFFENGFNDYTYLK